MKNKTADVFLIVRKVDYNKHGLIVELYTNPGLTSS